MMKGLGVSLQLWTPGRPRVVTVLLKPLFMIHLTFYCQGFWFPVLFPFPSFCNSVSRCVVHSMGVIEETANRLLPFLSAY